jgi:hypothetical protein
MPEEGLGLTHSLREPVRGHLREPIRMPTTGFAPVCAGQARLIRLQLGSRPAPQ